MYNKVVWVCGQFRGKDDAGNPAWDLQGVFDSEAASVDACQGLNDFICSVPLNRRLPAGATEWPNIRYPLVK